MSLSVFHLYNILIHSLPLPFTITFRVFDQFTSESFKRVKNSKRYYKGHRYLYNIQTYVHIFF